MEDNGQSSASDTLDAGEERGKKGADAAKKGAKAAKKLGKAAKAAKAAGLFATPVGWVILGIIAAIILIFLIIGTVSFLQTMPGLVLGKLEELGKGLWTGIVKWTTGNDWVWNDQIVELAEYVEGMGYTLYEFGFGKPIYDEEHNIKKMDDNYESPLLEYILADKRTYSGTNDTPFLAKLGLFPARLIGSLYRGDGIDFNDNGMLHIDNEFIKSMSVDFENKQLITKNFQGLKFWGRENYAYSLDGWTGRYGMPQSFSIALHLSTMKPDLVTTMIDEFHTNVYIEKTETKINLSAKYQSADGTSYDADTAYNEGYIDKNLRDHIKEDLHKTIEIFQPYIDKVTDHWYYKTIDFSNAYETISGEEYSNSYTVTANSDTNENAAKAIQDNTGSDGDKGMIIITERGADERKIQVRQPEIEEGANDKIKKIFAGSYYTYDGSKLTADAIETARKNKDDSLKKPVSFEKRDALEAFSILENCKDLDSQYVYRDLKKLLIELEYFTEEDFEKPDTLVLKWILGGYVPPKWPQHENEVSHGAILYSKASEGKEETGFDAEKKVTSPGKGVITKISEDSITIKFTDPEKEAVLDMTIKISGFAVNPELHEGDEVEEGADIGTTTDSDITIILKDPKGSIIDYIEDYLSPKKSAFDSEWSFLYWLPYESGGIDGKGNGPECVGVLIEGEEAAVGIAQWTTKGNTNNIEAFCRYAYEMDPVLCAELQQFIGKSPSWILSNMNRVKNAFADVCNTPEDRDAFLNLQVAKFKEEFDNYANAKNASWLIDRPTVVQATIASLRNWTGDGTNWTKDREGSTYTTKNDLEIIRDTLYRACFIPTDVGTLEGRWESQYVLAKDILEGVISEEELENWVRNGNISRYGNGKNAGTLLR